MTEGKLFYVSATGIIYKERKYLIARRSEKEKLFPGMWTVPGGKLEVKDFENMKKTTKDAWYGVLSPVIRREIREETGLEVGPIYYLLDLVVVRPNSYPTLILSFYCPYRSGKVKLNHEHTECKWVTAREAENYELIDGILEEIRMVDERLKKGEAGPMAENL